MLIVDRMLLLCWLKIRVTDDFILAYVLTVGHFGVNVLECHVSYSLFKGYSARNWLSDLSLKINCLWIFWVFIQVGLLCIVYDSSEVFAFKIHE